MIRCSFLCALKSILQISVLASLKFSVEKSQVLPYHLLLGPASFLLPLSSAYCWRQQSFVLPTTVVAAEDGDHTSPVFAHWRSSLDLEQLLKSINSHLSSRLRKLCSSDLKVELRAGNRSPQLLAPSTYIVLNLWTLKNILEILFIGCHT